MATSSGQASDGISRATVAVVGAGWYGTHIALSLAKMGFKVSLFDMHAEILAAYRVLLVFGCTTRAANGLELHVRPNSALSLTHALHYSTMSRIRSISLATATQTAIPVKSG